MHPDVLHVVLSLSPGGTERVVIELTKKTRPAVRGVVCLDEAGAWSSQLVEAGIPVTQLGRRPGFRPKLGLDIVRVARRSGARILHCHHYSPFVYGRLATMIAPDLRIVFTEHGRLSDAAPSAKRRFANPILARFAGSMNAVSYDLRNHMIESGFPATRIGVVHNGIDPGPVVTDERAVGARLALDIPQHAPVLGTVGRLDAVKDLPTLFRAVQMLKERWPRIRLLVVGDGAERATLTALCRELNLEKSVLFLGHRDDARAVMPAFDVYVNSSISEGISLTLLEAMAASRPIVATRVGGTAEVVDHDVTGLLVPSRSPGQLAGAIEPLLCSTSLRTAMGHAGRWRMERRFSLDRMARDYAAIYDEVQRI